MRLDSSFSALGASWGLKPSSLENLNGDLSTRLVFELSSEKLINAFFVYFFAFFFCLKVKKYMYVINEDGYKYIE